MMNETLFRETFSQLHASDEAKREVLTMVKKRHAGRARRVGRAMGLAAALTAALAVTAGAVNLATNGELFRRFSVVWSNGFQMQLEDEAGNQITAYLLHPEVEKIDGRVIFRASEQEIDITEALEQEGFYRFEDPDTDRIIEVTGDTEQWTVTTFLEDGTISYGLTTSCETPAEESPSEEGRTAASLENGR